MYGINHFPSKILFGSIWSDWSLHVALNCEVYTVISGAATAQLGDYFLAAYETGFTIKRVPYMWNDPKLGGENSCWNAVQRFLFPLNQSVVKCRWLFCKCLWDDRFWIDFVDGKFLWQTGEDTCWCRRNGCSFGTGGFSPQRIGPMPGLKNIRQQI